MTDQDLVIAGRYRLGARLGSGAMGIVWQAHDERLHRTVAVKQMLLQPGLTPAQAEEARLRCMREGRIAARLAHHNAITVYDVAEHDGEPWLVMEYLPSQSLAAVLAERGALPPQEAARIGTQVATALIAAHAAGIVHRDVKPANVLLGDDGAVKITDFGISRATGDITVTATGMLAGTPAYLAPEVAKGEQPTPASDVFSLGSTLYTAVEGHSPFGLSENTLALLYAVAAGKVTPPRQAGPLTALLMQLLRTDPAERPAMVEARDALAAVAAGKPALSPSAAATEVMAPHRQPNGPGTPPSPAVPGLIPVGPATPERGDRATRLDPHPFTDLPPSEPTVRAQGAVRHDAPARPGPPPRGAAAAAAAPANRGRSARSIALTVLAIVAAALVGILVASLLTDDGNPGQAQPPATSSTNTPTPTSPSTTAPSPTTTSTAPSAADYENAVRQYYALLPGDPDAAWQRLTERAQQKSKSQDAYKEFWAGITSVEVLSTRAEGNRVAATLRFTTTESKTSTEAYSFALVERDGELKIDNFEKTSRGGEDGEGDDDEPPESSQPPTSG